VVGPAATSGKLASMFVRIRWFIAGVVATVGGMSYLVAQVRKARQKVSPANLIAAGKEQAAAWLDAVAERVAPDHPGQNRR
jgi:hypothetical protein